MHPALHRAGVAALAQQGASRFHLEYVAAAGVVVVADQAVGMGGSHCIVPVAPAVADGRLRHLYGSGAGAGCRWGKG